MHARRPVNLCSWASYFTGWKGLRHCLLRLKAKLVEAVRLNPNTALCWSRVIIICTFVATSDPFKITPWKPAARCEYKHNDECSFNKWTNTADHSSACMLTLVAEREREWERVFTTRFLGKSVLLWKWAGCSKKCEGLSKDISANQYVPKPQPNTL